MDSETETCDCDCDIDNDDSCDNFYLQSCLSEILGDDDYDDYDSELISLLHQYRGENE